ncbi:MAG: GTP cyclohydrolase I FolE [Bacteroidales bacterium]
MRLKEELPSEERSRLLAEHYRAILELLGEDPEREGLRKSPERIARAMEFLVSGYSKSPAEKLQSALFQENYGNSERIILVKGIEFYSLCEHHMLPFFGNVHIGYIPNNKVVGLSKLSRLVEVFARRLQLQERMTQEILDAFNENVPNSGVIIMIEARHLCMQMRGVQKQNAVTTTYLYSGKFSQESKRREFFEMLNTPCITD